MRHLCLVLGLLLGQLAAQESGKPHVHTNRRSSARLPLPKQEGSFHFAVFGDRTGGRPEGIRVLDQAVKDCNLLDPDLVMTVGDLVQGYGSTKDWLAQTREFKQSMGRLRMPWFPVAGNHDTYQRDQRRRMVGGHEDEYEQHFGPLWYWFAHKNCAFIVLFSDEGNPKTGEVSFGKPECQKMSPEQFAWLRQTLQKNRGRDHCFVFLHHPRWHKGRYGDDWDRVHKALVKAGNVRAVFAGHIHHMVYAGKPDGIEYFTLGTTGGSVNLDLPAKAGFLHHFNIVTVRKNGIQVATLPVGSVLDPRKIDKQVAAEVRDLHRRLRAPGRRPLQIRTDGSVTGSYTATIHNPCSRPLEVTLLPETSDPRWSFGPDHQHALIPPGKSRQLSFKVLRSASALDQFLRLPALRLQCDYLAPGFRVSLQERRVAVTVVPLVPPTDPQPGQAFLQLGRRGHLSPTRGSANNGWIRGSCTLEAYLRARDLDGRRCLMFHPALSLTLDQGSPVLQLGKGRRRTSIKANKALRADGSWQHLAAVVDGDEARLYIDGQLVARKAVPQARRPDAAGRLEIGRGRGARNRPQHYAGLDLDQLRISSTARFGGGSFTPTPRQAAWRRDPQTVLLLDFERALGPWVEDRSGQGRHLLRQDGARRAQPAPR